MKDVVTTMIQHPIRTSVIIGAIGLAISDAIYAIRGIKCPIPRFNLVINSTAKTGKTE
jgi:hypothetical protein